MDRLAPVENWRGEGAVGAESYPLICFPSGESVVKRVGEGAEGVGGQCALGVGAEAEGDTVLRPALGPALAGAEAVDEEC